jgi:hypothetical protein
MSDALFFPVGTDDWQTISNLAHRKERNSASLSELLGRRAPADFRLVIE